MVGDGTFVDYYSIMGVNPNCDATALEAAFRLLAKRYHPDHAETTDVERFGEVVEAYKTLKHPNRRAEYDLHYARATGFRFAAEAPAIDEDAALSDAEAHRRILLFLYRRRREQAQDPGVGRYFVQELLDCPDETFEFHLWYLKEKGFVVTTEQGTLAITIDGVDHVMAMSRIAQEEQRLLTRARPAAGPAGP